MALKTDYKDEVLSSSQPYRTYNIVDSNGSPLYSGVRINRADTPQQEGTKFGASDINSTNAQVNKNTTQVGQQDTSIKNLNSNKSDKFTYSTDSEKLTGDKWIDGKNIYCKVVSYIFPSSSSGTPTAQITPHRISNIDKVINMIPMWLDTEDNRFYFYSRWDTATTFIKFSVDRTNVIAISAGVNFNTRTKDRYVILYYTKTTD